MAIVSFIQSLLHSVYASVFAGHCTVAVFQNMFQFIQSLVFFPVVGCCSVDVFAVLDILQ
jgi:hypothetical protein